MLTIPHPKTLYAFLFLIVAGIAGLKCSKPYTGDIIYERLKPCNSEELDSTTLCGTLSVFENLQAQSGRKINLNVVVIPAIRKDPTLAPIFFLEGGPGVAATAGAGFYADTINHYRLKHDIVLVDVRGTGQSNPLHCRQLQYKENLQQQMQEMYPVNAVKACYDSLSKLADLTQYTTTNMAMDIEEVRRWLGYGKINLFGLSYGTRLAQVYMKMFPGSVRSTVLWSPTTINSKLPLYHARFADESLKKLFEDCKSDTLCNQSFPDLDNEFQRLANKSKEKPFIYNFTSENETPVEIIIPWYAFHTKIRAFMYSPFGLRQIPHLVHEASLGNWKPFISKFPSGPSYNDFIADGLYLCVTCTDDVPFITAEDVKSWTEDTFMGDYRVVQQQQACANWAKGTVPDNYFEPLRSDVPTLIFSGYFDPVTPPSMAEEIVSRLSNGYLISIPTMSHTFDGLSYPECFDRIVVDFFDNPSIRPNSDCTNQMVPGDYTTGRILTINK